MNLVRHALVTAVLAASCTSPASSPAATGEGGSALGWRQLDCVSAIGSPADANDEPGFSKGAWKTDFGKHCVPLSEITSGGPSPDGIPPIDAPKFVSQRDADAWLEAPEPVIAVAEGNEARAYPLKILLWHEIVNDTVGGRPVVVTFCPLCNTSIVFDRRVEGAHLTFGTTGNLRYSDLVMWDRQTQSWWQQATGEAIVGELAGKRLQRVTSLVVSYEEFKKAHAPGVVLSKDTGHTRPYGRNPYAGYDRADTPPIPAFWGGRSIDRRLLPKARVAVATFSDPPTAYPIDDLRGAVAINDVAGDRPYVLFYLSGVASPLDRSSTNEGSDVGQAAFFDPVVDGRRLSFRAEGLGFVDEQTRSRWLVTGRAVDGPLAGTTLKALPHEVTFWFIWSVFRPETQVRAP